MPIRSFMKPGVFGPETIAVMVQALEAACDELHVTGRPQTMREVMARRIVAAASTGERDPARLREAALPWLVSK